MSGRARRFGTEDGRITDDELVGIRVPRTVRKIKNAPAWLARRSYYALQATTSFRFDEEVVLDVDAFGARALNEIIQSDRLPNPEPIRRRSIHEFDLADKRRYELAKADVHLRFVVEPNGQHSDEFGRNGTWRPRGCEVYYDKADDSYLKVFEPTFCLNGEGRFLVDALDAGVYRDISPGLRFLITDDDERVRGYAITAGRLLTPYEFDQMVGATSYADLICEVTRRSGFYWNDLRFHNVILLGNTPCFIDLESILPVDWYKTDLAFARSHLCDVDIGWPLQRKWNSPRWYADFLDELKAAGQQGQAPKVSRSTAPADASPHLPSRLKPR